MDELLAQVPPRLRDRFREIVALTDDFCGRTLTAEFRDICREVAVAACQEGLPVTSGKAAGWAAGVVATVGFVNFLGETSRQDGFKRRRCRSTRRRAILILAEIRHHSSRRAPSRRAARSRREWRQAS